MGLTKTSYSIFIDRLEETIRNKNFFYIGLAFPRLIRIYTKISSHFIRSIVNL